MSGPLENMTSMKEANCETEIKQRMQSQELWRRLDLYRLALLSSRSRETTADGGATERKLALGLLKDVEPRLLFLAVDFSYGQTGDEVKRRAVETALLSVFGSTVGPEMYQQQVADTLVALCEEADGRAAVTPATGGVATGCRRAVMGALASQIGEVIAGLTARQAATPKLRFADIATRLMSASDSAFAAAVDSGALALVTDLTEDASDVLLQLNALDLLDRVASTAGGARHLVANGHLDKLLVAAGGGEGDSPDAPDPLLGASALRTLAKAWKQRSPSSLGGFLRACTVHIEGQDEGGKLAGLGAASEVAAASDVALRAMLSQERGSEGVLDAWLTLSAHKVGGVVFSRNRYRQAPPHDTTSALAHLDDHVFGECAVDVKAAALHAVASVLGPPNTSSTASSSTPTAAAAAAAAAGNDEDGDQVMGNTAAAEAAKERSTLCLMLFTRLSESNTNQRAGGWLLDLARQPVSEVRHAAYAVMRCAAWQPGGWGLSALLSQPGFLEFLEKRDTAASKATKEWHFSLVESIMSCKDQGTLDNETLESLRTILKQGPFWVPTKSRGVATAE
ncbi:unnamed protein product [Ectocarpus sp. CCAP 1310/34]|nr:unnamed protein product [Ectocarpus sp. CCAP 1310/34]